MFPCALDPPASKSMRIDAFSHVSNSIRPRTGLPHLSTSIPTHSDASWLDFEPNPTIVTPGPPRTIPEPMALAKRPNEAIMTSKHDGNEWVDEDKHQLGVSKGKEWQELENPRNADGDSSKWSHSHFSNAPTPQNPAPHLLVPKATRITSPTSPLATNRCESTSSSPPHQLVAKTPCIASPGGTHTSSTSLPM